MVCFEGDLTKQDKVGGSVGARGVADDGSGNPVRVQ